MTSHQTVDGIELDHIYPHDLFVNVAMIYHLASLLLIHKEYFMMLYDVVLLFLNYCLFYCVIELLSKGQKLKPF